MFKYMLPSPTLQEIEQLIQSSESFLSSISPAQAFIVSQVNVLMKSGNFEAIESLSQEQLVALESDNTLGDKIVKFLQGLWKFIKDTFMRIINFFKRMHLDTRDLKSVLNSVTEEEFSHAVYGDPRIKEFGFNCLFSTDWMKQAVDLDMVIDSILKEAISAYSGFEKIIQKSNSTRSYSDYPAEEIKSDFEYIADVLCEKIEQLCNSRFDVKFQNGSLKSVFITLEARRSYTDLYLDFDFDASAFIKASREFASTDHAHPSTKSELNKLVEIIDMFNGWVKNSGNGNLSTPEIGAPSKNLRTRYIESAMTSIAKFCSKLVVAKSKTLPRVFSMLEQDRETLKKLLNYITSKRWTGKSDLN